MEKNSQNLCLFLFCTEPFFQDLKPGTVYEIRQQLEEAFTLKGYI